MEYPVLLIGNISLHSLHGTDRRYYAVQRSCSILICLMNVKLIFTVVQAKWCHLRQAKYAVYIDELPVWMSSKKLKINPSTIEIM